MCFSAEASFVTSGLLSASGVMSLRVAKNEQRLIALVPLFFAVQQAIEGMQWLHLHRGVSSAALTFAFLFFGFVLWPVFVPVIIYRVDSARRHILKWFILAGAIVSLIYLTGFVAYPLSVLVVHDSISYQFTVPFGVGSSTLYALTIFGALFISSKRVFAILGAVIGCLALLTKLLFYLTFASVWCFFVAVISGLIYAYVRQESAVPLTGEAS